MAKDRIIAAIVLLAAVCTGFFVYFSEVRTQGAFSSHPFKLGLDLNGGTELIYQADVTSAKGDVNEAMNTLRDVIERRVNLFGVSEPIIQVEKSTASGKTNHRLIVELPGITNISDAIALIGLTPQLEFRLVKKDLSTLPQVADNKTFEEYFEATGLTGQYLERASLEFNPTTSEPSVAVQFNKEGEALFAKITKEHVGKQLAIFLDSELKSAPVIREEITGGRASISGSFKLDEAKTLVRNLNYGALPVKIDLINTQSVGATLGEIAVKAGVKAGIIAFLVIALFLIIWYRLPGLLATIALSMYVALNLALFKLIPVTLTAAGIAGFILSIGMAVDANILIFERMKEELRRGKKLHDAIYEGFDRAWLSIRDSNLSSIITATILYYFASSSVVKGFALVFGIGVLTSMFTAITASRMFLLSLGVLSDHSFIKFIFGSGIIPSRSKN
jgi:protein-export membrane protein SecD